MENKFPSFILALLFFFLDDYFPFDKQQLLLTQVNKSAAVAVCRVGGGVCPEGVSARGCLVRGGVYPEGRSVWPAGGCLVGGVCPRGCVCPARGVCTLPRGQRDTCENVTFPQPLLRTLTSFYGFYSRNADDSQDTWIGLYQDTGDHADHRWVDGTPFVLNDPGYYQLWLKNDPNEKGAGAVRLLATTYQFADRSPSNKYWVMCEKSGGKFQWVK